MAEIIEGAVTVDDMALYKRGGISSDLILKASPKLGVTKTPRRFYSNVRALMILVKGEPDRIGIDGKVISGEVDVVRFRDGKYTTSNPAHILAIEESYTYGSDTYDLDAMAEVVEEKNLEFVLAQVAANPQAAKVLRARFMSDFLEAQKPNGPSKDAEMDELPTEDAAEAPKQPRKARKKE